eukprot:gene5956-4265_t
MSSLEDRAKVLEGQMSVVLPKIASVSGGTQDTSANAVDETTDTPRVAEVRQWCRENGMTSAVLLWVPRSSESVPLETLRQMTSADSLQHFCKSILIANTHCTREDCSDPRNSRYYIVHLQYVERFDAAMLTKVVRDWNPGLGKKKFSFTFAPPEVFQEVTGYDIGAMVPFATRCKIPVILSSSVLSLSPGYMWYGAGDVFCKLQTDVQNFIDVVKPFIESITVPVPPENYKYLIV